MKTLHGPDIYQRHELLCSSEHLSVFMSICGQAVNNPTNETSVPESSSLIVKVLL